MAYGRKIVLHCRSGYRPELNALIEEFMKDGVTYVGVVGEDAARVEDIIDELCIGNGLKPYNMLTASHDKDESVEDAVKLAQSLSQEFAGEVEIVEF